eukprot:3455108-Rhodomonas_salina.1
MGVRRCGPRDGECGVEGMGVMCIGSLHREDVLHVCCFKRRAWGGCEVGRRKGRRVGRRMWKTVGKGIGQTANRRVGRRAGRRVVSFVTFASLMGSVTHRCDLAFTIEEVGG